MKCVPLEGQIIGKAIYCLTFSCNTIINTLLPNMLIFFITYRCSQQIPPIIWPTAISVTFPFTFCQFMANLHWNNGAHGRQCVCLRATKPRLYAHFLDIVSSHFILNWHHNIVNTYLTPALIFFSYIDVLMDHKMIVLQCIDYCRIAVSLYFQQQNIPQKVSKVFWSLSLIPTPTEENKLSLIRPRECANCMSSVLPMLDRSRKNNFPLLVQDRGLKNNWITTLIRLVLPLCNTFKIAGRIS